MLRRLIVTLCVAYFPTHAFGESTLVAAGGSNGLYVSRDRGYTWEKNTALGDVFVRDVAIDRTNLDRLYAVTSEALLASDDGGDRWSASEFQQPAKIQRLISAGAGLVFLVADGAMWSSSDAGRHWTSELGLPTGVLDLAVDGDNPPTVYASTASGIFKKSAGGAWIGLPSPIVIDRIAADPDVPGRLFAASGSDFVLTLDGGGTWTRLASISAETAAAAVGMGLSGTYDLTMQMNVRSLAVGQADNDIIVLADVSVTWDGVRFPWSTGILALQRGVWQVIQIQLNSGIAPQTLVADKASNLVLVSDAVRGLVYRGTLAGKNWTKVAGFDGISVNSVAIATAHVEPWSQVHVGTSEGLFSSSDGGEKWQGNTGLGNVTVFAIGVDQGGSGLLLASTSSGLLRSTNAGASWDKTELPPEIQASAIAIDPKAEGRAYLVERHARDAQRLRLWTSNDRGRSWYQMASQPEGIRDVALYQGTTPTIIYVTAGRLGVLKSTDEGLTWTSVYSRSVANLVRVGEPAGTIYVDGEDGVWKTENGGQSWRFMGPPIRSVVPNPPGEPLYEWIWLDWLAMGSGRNEGLIGGCVSLIAFYGPFPPGSEVEAASLFSFDGDRWHTSQVNAVCGVVEIDPRAAGLMYWGSRGLWRSPDAGRNWSQAHGLENLTVYAIATGPLQLANLTQ